MLTKILTHAHCSLRCFKYLCFRVTQMSCGVWTSIHPWSSSSPAPRTDRSTSGTPTLISLSGARPSRWLVFKHKALAWQYCNVTKNCKRFDKPIFNNMCHPLFWLIYLVLCSRIKGGLPVSIPVGLFWLWGPWLEGQPFQNSEPKHNFHSWILSLYLFRFVGRVHTYSLWSFG